MIRQFFRVIRARRESTSHAKQFPSRWILFGGRFLFTVCWAQVWTWELVGGCDIETRFEADHARGPRATPRLRPWRERCTSAGPNWRVSRGVQVGVGDTARVLCCEPAHLLGGRCSTSNSSPMHSDSSKMLPAVTHCGKASARLSLFYALIPRRNGAFSLLSLTI